MKTRKANQKSKPETRKQKTENFSSPLSAFRFPQEPCSCCGLSADQIAQKIRHAQRILARRKDRQRAARALVVIRHGVALFDEIGGVA